MTTREARHYRKGLGLCVHHPFRDAVPGYSMCDPCLEARATRQANQKARWIAEGKCSRCGGEREDVARRMCARCMVYSRDNQRKQKAKVPDSSFPVIPAA